MVLNQCRELSDEVKSKKREYRRNRYMFEQDK